MIIRKCSVLPVVILGTGLALFSPVAQSASVNWGAAQNITDESDVSTNGTSVGAFNVGSTNVPSTTVNGVSFLAFAAPGGNGTAGNFTTSSTSASADNNAAGSPNAPFINLSANYQTLLKSCVTFSGPLLTLTMSGLTIGAEYQFQWWCNSSDGFGYDTTASAGNDVNLRGDVGNTDGGLGQFALGTFTADSALQSILFSPGEVGHLNAFQLRQIPQQIQGVPESGRTLGLLGIGTLGLVSLQRRFRSRL